MKLLTPIQKKKKKEALAIKSKDHNITAISISVTDLLKKLADFCKDENEEALLCVVLRSKQPDPPTKP